MAFDTNQIAQALIDNSTKEIVKKLADYVNGLVDPVSEDFEARIAALETSVDTETTGLLDRVTAVETALDGIEFELTSPQSGEVLKFNGTKWVNAADAIE